MPNDALQGAGVLVTRPTEQADELVAAIEQQGGRAIRFPVIEIAARSRAAIVADLAQIPRADIAVFVSGNAVHHGCPFAADAKIAAIGPATVAALGAAGYKVDFAPATRFDSEGLLAEFDSHDVAGKAVIIFRGQDGRELLAESLRARGANVFPIAVYDRLCPQPATEQLAELEARWKLGEIHFVTVMSVASLGNLLTLLPASMATMLDSVPLVTPAARVIKETLESYPLATPTLSSGPQAGKIVDAIIQLHRNTSGPAP